MRRILILLSVSLFSVGAALAQSLNVHEGQVTYSYPYDETTTMTYGTNTLTINGEEFELANITSITGSSEQLSPAQVYVNYDGTTATIVMSGDLRGRVTAQLSGANVTLTDVAVAEEGELSEVTYHLSGASSDGSFLHTGSYKCAVSLEGVSLQSSACPMQIDNGKRIDIIVAEGTQNTFCDGGNNMRKSAFWVKGHAEFSGAGVLNITGTQRHAYSSNEYTQLKKSFTGTINILGAASDGMHVDQYYEQRSGKVTFANVVGDNIDVACTTDAQDEFNGQVIISGGVLNCVADGDDAKCIKSEASMAITGGDLSLRCTGDGSKGLSVAGDLLVEQDVEAASNVRPRIYMLATGDEYVNPVDASDTSKCRGIKVKGAFTFNGGTIERDPSSTVKSSKIISVDGDYIYKAGTYSNCSFSK